jgi:hypothetical protein
MIVRRSLAIKQHAKTNRMSNTSIGPSTSSDWHPSSARTRM